MFHYLVICTRTENFTDEVIQPHKEFLAQLKVDGKIALAGPFTDKSGGAYILKASNIKEAEKIAHSDPLFLTRSSDFTIYEWITH